MALGIGLVAAAASVRALQLDRAAQRDDVVLGCRIRLHLKWFRRPGGHDIARGRLECRRLESLDRLRGRHIALRGPDHRGRGLRTGGRSASACLHLGLRGSRFTGDDRRNVGRVRRRRRCQRLNRRTRVTRRRVRRPAKHGIDRDRHYLVTGLATAGALRGAGRGFVSTAGGFAAVVGARVATGAGASAGVCTVGGGVTVDGSNPFASGWAA